MQQQLLTPLQAVDAVGGTAQRAVDTYAQSVRCLVQLGLILGEHQRVNAFLGCIKARLATLNDDLLEMTGQQDPDAT